MEVFYIFNVLFSHTSQSPDLAYDGYVPQSRTKFVEGKFYFLMPLDRRVSALFIL